MARAPLVSLRDVRLQDGPLPLFDGVDLAIEPGQHACLVGRNGAGKSTLMKLVMGLIEADSGERAVQAGARFSYVPQEPVIIGPTLRDHATSGGADPWAADQWLETFGLDPEKPATRLSGGETRRADLARAFAEQPNLLLLDEPTNHLDILAIETLEDELKAARFAVLMVSHDRTFLERTTKRCLWLENRRVRTLDKGFKAFDAWAAKVTEEEAESLRRLTKEIERETYTFYRSITAQRTRNEGRARRLDALRQDRARRVADLPRDIQLGVDAGPTSGKLVAELKGVAKSFSSQSRSDGEEDREAVEGPVAASDRWAVEGPATRTILKPFSTKVMRGDRLAIVGPNGAGKTTLVRLLLGEIEADAGSIRLGANLAPVYLDQARADLRSDMTLWDALTPGGGDSILVRGQSKHVAAYAKDFLFKESQLRQPVSTLSGGERNRLLLARALAQPANLLILDEPTNDLDMETLDRLEDLLEDYDGTLILVSHDRDFIDRLATSTIALNGRGDAVETPGGWTDFVAQNPGFLSPSQPEPARRPLPIADGEGDREAVEGAPQALRQSSKKLSYKDARRLEEAEREMESLPAAIETLETALADPALYTTDRKRFDKLSADLDATRARLEAAETDWLRIEEMKATLTA